MAWLTDHLADLIGIATLIGILAFAITYQRHADWKMTRPGRALMYTARGFSATIILLVAFSFLPEVLRALNLDHDYRSWRWVAEAIVYSPTMFAVWNLYFTLRESLGLKTNMLFFVPEKPRHAKKTRWYHKMIDWMHPHGKEDAHMPTFGEIPKEVSIADETTQPYPVEPGDAVITSTTAEPVVPTQVANPGRASIRSFFQNLVGGLLLVNPVFLVIQQTMHEVTSFVFPEWAWATVNGVVIGSALVATLITRIMAVPGVNSFIEKHVHFLAPQK